MRDKDKKPEFEINIPLIISVNALVMSIILACCVILAM
jgi:hypothetical protein